MIGIRGLRGMVWDVKSEHTVQRVYVRDKKGLKIMLSGQMKFEFPKETVVMDFAAELGLIEEGDELKAAVFTVFVV